MISNWKPNSTNSVVPTNSRPFHNKDPNLGSIGRVPFKPNPIKHWRKQLKPYYKTNSKQVSIDMINAPSSAVYVKSNIDCDNNNYQLLKENISLLNECYGIKNIEASGEVTCSGGTNHITRSANTNIKKNYFVNYKNYLQKRCKTYEQNSMIGEKINENEYKSSQCSDLSCGNKKVIYKPNNSAFMIQGATSSSANTLRNKNKALTNNSASLKTAYGTAPVFIRDYKPGTTGYEIKYVKGDTSSNKPCQQLFKSCK